jgi:hypothetical protein
MGVNKTAEELMRELRANPEHQQRLRARQAAEAEIRAKTAADEALLCAEFRQAHLRRRQSCRTLFVSR